MTQEFFLALLAVGGVAVAAVAVINWLQTRRLRPQHPAKPLRRGEKLDDGNSMREPTLGALPTDSDGGPLAALEDPPELSPKASPVVRLAPVMDSATDGIAVFDFPHPILGDRLLPQVQSVRRVGSKPVAMEGVLEGDIEGQWRPIEAGLRWQQVRVGVLLANRSGALHAVEWAEFGALLSHLSQVWGVAPMVPDTVSTLEAARDLDRLCSTLDVQIGLNVRFTLPVSPPEVERVAMDLGLVEQGSGRYAAQDEHGQVLFTVSSSEAPNTLLILCDVPRVSAAAHPFDGMVQVALSFAQQLAGEVVDDAGLRLGPEALSAIQAQLEDQQATLEAAGLPAGSPRALRVFN